MNGFNLSAVPRVEPLFAFNTHTLLNASHCLIFIMFTTNSFLKIKQWDAFSCLRPFIVVNSRILNLRSTWAKHIISIFAGSKLCKNAFRMASAPSAIKISGGNIPQYCLNGIPHCFGNNIKITFCFIVVHA